jgi:hypothetical protein
LAVPVALISALAGAGKRNRGQFQRTNPDLADVLPIVAAGARNGALAAGQCRSFKAAASFGTDRLAARIAVTGRSGSVYLEEGVRVDEPGNGERTLFSNWRARRA